MRIVTCLAALIVAIPGWTNAARAEININGHYHIDTIITVRNATSNDITFNRTASVCSPQAPASFVAKANSDTVITVPEKYWDTGFDNCYAKYHNIVYTMAGDPKSFIQVHQLLSSNNYACLDIKEYILFWINYAICPAAGGRVVTAGTANGGGVYCPPNTPQCPPLQGAASNSFGFLVTSSPGEARKAMLGSARPGTEPRRAVPPNPPKPAKPGIRKGPPPKAG